MIISEDIKEEIVRLRREGLLRAEIARRFGICVSSVQNVLSARGMATQRRPDPEIDRRITELYPDYSATEIAEMIGDNAVYIDHRAALLGLRHTPAARERFKQKRRACQREKMKRPEVRANMSAKRKRVLKAEMHRLLGGEKQRTRYKINLLPRRLCDCIKRLRNKHGYITVLNSCTVYYDEQTDRRIGTRCTEEYYTRKYGITFRPLSDLS